MAAGSGGGAPSVASSQRSEGRGFPSGDSAAGDFLSIEAEADHRSYGYRPENPVRVRESEGQRGSAASVLYLRGLQGPQGQPISFDRRGSCCPFDHEASGHGGMLDSYELTWDGQDEPVLLYVDMYRLGVPRVPRGLTARR